MMIKVERVMYSTSVWADGFGGGGEVGLTDY